MLSAFIRSVHSCPAMLLAEQLVRQRYVRSGPLVLGTAPIKYPAPTTDRDRTVSRRSEPSSRTALIGEQPNPWDRIQGAAGRTKQNRINLSNTTYMSSASVQLRIAKVNPILLLSTCSTLYSVPGFGCSPIKAVRELGSERRETVRSLSVVGAGYLMGAVPSTRGPERTYLWRTSCSAKSIAGQLCTDRINAESI